MKIKPSDRQEVVVVTGASAGVGRAIVREFAKRRAKIGLIARGVDGLEGAKREVESAGGQALVLPLDVSDADAVEDAAQQVEDAFGPIDYWINVAMLSVFSPVKEMKPEEYKRVTEVTYLGYVYSTLAALKRMLPRDRGVIIQIGSALAYRGIPLQSAYCGSKHAIQGFNDSLRAELIHDKSKVRLTSLELPAVNTTQFGWVKSRLPNKPMPVPPIYQPEVIARAAVWATQHRRREIYIGWPTVEAIVGNKVWAGFADWYLGKTGYKSQQTDEKVSPDRVNNLWEPVPGDHGSHGTFDDKAKSFSPQLWADEHRIALGIAGVAALAGAAWLAAKLSGGGREEWV